MISTYLAIFLKFSMTALAAWVWRAGPSDTNFLGNSSWPQALMSPQFSSTDSETLLLYGGGYDCRLDALRDLFETAWILNVTTLEWTLIYGDLIDIDKPPVFGTSRTYGPEVVPGSRCSGPGAYDTNTNTISVHGGATLLGNQPNSHSTFQYNLTSGLWRWVAGLQNPSGFTYYLPPLPPKARMFEQSFFDHRLSQLYLFGGVTSGFFPMNDLWLYNVNTSSWSIVITNLVGTSQAPLPAFFEAPGEFSSRAIPGGRYGATGCYSSHFRLYFMFGGYGHDENPTGPQGFLADMWAFSVDRLQWAYFGGPKAVNSEGVYGTIDKSSVELNPRSRSLGYSAITKSGQVYLFGGRYSRTTNIFNIFLQLSDLWRFNTTSFEWTLLAGSSGFDVPGRSAGIRQESYENIPNPRSGGIAFYDETSRSFNVWGGKANYTTSTHYADLWTYYDRPIPTNSTGTPVIPVSPTDTNSRTIIILAVGGSLAVLMIVVYVVHQYISRLKQSKEFSMDIDFRQTFEATSVYQNQTTNGTTTQGITVAVHNEGLEIPGYLEVTNSDYTFVKSIAAGGGGEVFVAIPLSASLKEKCLIIVAKIMNVEDTFYQEIGIMHLLSESPYIAKLVGYCENPLTILMKYYELGTLFDYMKNNRFNNSIKVSFAFDIASGLQAMHTASIAHNDIKPQNVLIDFVDGRFSCVLTDFGISHVLGTNLLSVGAFPVRNLRGITLRYAAPENIQRFRDRLTVGANKLFAGDIYSLSMLKYLIVTRLQPWE